VTRRRRVIEIINKRIIFSRVKFFYNFFRNW